MDHKELRAEILSKTGLDINNMSDDQKREMIKKTNEDVEKLEKSKKFWKVFGVAGICLILLYVMIT